MKIFKSFIITPTFQIFFLVILVMLSGCQSSDLQGQFISDSIIDEINSKKPRHDEVINLLGTPTYTPEYSSNTWYYIQRSLSKIACFSPKLVEQRIVKLTFDESKRLIEAKLLLVGHNEKSVIENKYTKPHDTKQNYMQKFIKSIDQFNKITDN